MVRGLLAVVGGVFVLAAVSCLGGNLVPNYYTAERGLQYHQPMAVLADSVEHVRPGRPWLKWYREVEECSGYTADPDSIRWFVFKQAWMQKKDSGGSIRFRPFQPLAGYRWNQHIYIGRAYADSAWLVRHESLHYLLSKNGVPDSIQARHEHPAFKNCLRVEQAATDNRSS